MLIKFFSDLGTFGKVEQVLLVGTAGGIPALKSKHHHLKLGDVIATSGENNQPAYVYVNNVTTGREGLPELHTQTWTPSGKVIRDALLKLEKSSKNAAKFEEQRKSSEKFVRDHLEDSIPEAAPQMFDTPHLHFGAIGAGKMLTKSDDVTKCYAAAFLTGSCARMMRKTTEAIFSYVRNMRAAIKTVWVIFVSRPLYKPLKPFCLNVHNT